MSIEIRPIEESDIAAFRSAVDSVAREKRWLLTAEAPPLDQAQIFVRNNIASDYAQYVAYIGPDLIGWADIIPRQVESLAHTGVLGMGVILGHRGKGIGKSLLQRTIEHSWRSGLKRIELEVFANNHAAISLYENSGFVHEGLKRKARLINDEYIDVCIMANCCI